jgi:hypothetical protein
MPSQKSRKFLSDFTREHWILGCFIAGRAARMASNAGNNEIILLFSAREYRAKADSPNWLQRTRYRSPRCFQKPNVVPYDAQSLQAPQKRFAPWMGAGADGKIICLG